MMIERVNRKTLKFSDKIRGLRSYFSSKPVLLSTGHLIFRGEIISGEIVNTLKSVHHSK